MDLCLRHRSVALGMELNVWRPVAPDPLSEELAQLYAYLPGLRPDSGWLVIFDRCPGLAPRAERLAVSEAVSPKGA